MFSSVVSFIFGTNTSATANSEANQNPTTTSSITNTAPDQQQDDVRIDAENTIEVTSATPSVTGAVSKRGKNRRNRNKNNSRQGGGPVEGPRTSTPTITKLLLGPNETFEEDFDEDDWLIVDKEDEDESLPRTDSEEELSFVETAPQPAAVSPIPPVQHQAEPQQQQPSSSRRRQHINSHSYHAGPRAQRNRYDTVQTRKASGEPGARLNSRFSPRRSVAGAVSGGTAGANANAHANATVAADVAAGGNVTQSLYANVPSYRDVAVAGASAAHNTSSSSTASSFGVNCSMDDSWYMTPPPCFTSVGPVNMETSPYENLLIEHPSMSVYHSIRSAQEATDSFVNLDLGVEEPQRRAAAEKAEADAAANNTEEEAEAAVVAAVHEENVRDIQAIRERTARNARLDRASAAQLKQELLERDTQKCYEKKQRLSLCRGAMKRANKARDVQSSGKPKRRADMQHCRIYSGVNNNRNKSRC